VRNEIVRKPDAQQAHLQTAQPTARPKFAKELASCQRKSKNSILRHKNIFHNTQQGILTSRST